jgi:adenosylmethionine-8-amino-7-oxononanoate aminotransferase
VVTTLGHRIPGSIELFVSNSIASRTRRSSAMATASSSNSPALAKLSRWLIRTCCSHRTAPAAVEQALKIAFQYWANIGVAGKHTYLAFGDAYHGDTVGGLSLGGGGFGTEVFESLRFPCCAHLRSRIRKHRVAADMVRDTRATDGCRCRAACAGCCRHVDCAASFVRATANGLRETGVLLVCDEVATGFGRAGTLFASEACGLRPDLMCLGKGITGGYLPMSATVANDRVFNAFRGPDLSERTLYHGHSYGGNALAAAVALRHLELMREWRVLDNVRARSAQLESELRARLGTKSVVRDIRIAGLMCAVELNPEGRARFARRVSAAMVHRGVLARSLGDNVILVPPLTVTADEIERIVATLFEALEEVSA